MLNEVDRIKPTKAESYTPDSPMHEFEQLLTASIKSHLKGNKRPVILQLSGGCDSVAIFFSLLNLTKDFTCHAYMFKKDSKDIISSRQISEMYGFMLIEHHLTEDEVFKNRQILHHYGIRDDEEVNLDCMCCHYKMSRVIKNSLVFNGSFADALFGAYKSLEMKKKYPEEFKLARMAALNKYNSDGSEYLQKLMSENGNLTRYPFYDETLIDFFMSADIRLLGLSKKMFFEAFGDRLPEKHNVRRRSQQIDSGVRDAKRRRQAELKLHGEKSGGKATKQGGLIY
jgi:asparagine synthetase B (glutamine-hydrolysing)